MRTTAGGGRERLSMDRGWRFHRGDIPQALGHAGWLKGGNFGGPIQGEYDDSSWRWVDLPHDFIVEGEFASVTAGDWVAPSPQSLYTQHGSLPPTIGWYRKAFCLPEANESGRLMIEFDGVARNCTVWLNQHYMERHLSGYTGFRFDVTDIAAYGKVNTLVVRVDATEYEGWFYEGGGIYRHVWLVRHDALHVAPHGVFVHSKVDNPADPRQATVTVETCVRNEAETGETCRVVVTIRDAAGREVAQRQQELKVAGGQSCNVIQNIDLPHPRLWSVDEPYLYTGHTAIQAGGRTTDELITTFGIRSLRFDPNRGFFLNGRALKIKGVCSHQDHAGVGAALPDSLQEFRIRRLKEMGCNAYRCSHNPPTPELLDACDRLGMLVMDENRLLNSSPEYLGQLEEMILRDRNHPSVILWSLANEENLQGADTGRRIATTMKRAVRRLDPTRPITQAMNGAWGKGVSDVVDVQGCNYIACGDVDAFHRQFPAQPIVFSECGAAGSTRGVYANDEKKGHLSAYDRNPLIGHTCEQTWTYFLKRPFVSGGFIWTGFDYRGEPSPYGWPCISSQFGIMDTCGFPKDNFFYFQAWWSGRTVLHVFPHWNWSGREGEPIEVWVHANCEVVELRLNGRSLGRKRVRTGGHLEWKVKYRPGVLEARGWKGAKLVKSTRVETTGVAAGIRLMPDRPALRADGEDAAAVTVQVVDGRGRVVPTADNEISLRVTNARILGVGNGDPSSHEPDKATRRRVFGGLAQAIVQAGRDGGRIVLEAESPGLRKATLTIEAEPAAVRPAVQTVKSRAKLRFKCSSLRKAAADIRRVALPPASIEYSPEGELPGQSPNFNDIRGFHKGSHGLLYLQASVEQATAGPGVFAYGADGPVKLWVNGKVVDCRPEATNPAVEGEYLIRVPWRRGKNRIVLGLSSNHGKAWGVFGSVYEVAD